MNNKLKTTMVALLLVGGAAAIAQDNRSSSGTASGRPVANDKKFFGAYRGSGTVVGKEVTDLQLQILPNGRAMVTSTNITLSSFYVDDRGGFGLDVTSDNGRTYNFSGAVSPARGSATAIARETSTITRRVGRRTTTSTVTTVVGVLNFGKGGADMATLVSKTNSFGSGTNAVSYTNSVPTLTTNATYFSVTVGGLINFACLSTNGTYTLNIQGTNVQAAANVYTATQINKNVSRVTLKEVRGTNTTERAYILYLLNSPVDNYNSTNPFAVAN